MSTFTIQDVVTDVRDAVQDTGAIPRYSDAQIVRAVNQVIKRMALLRPDLFAFVTNFTCAAGPLQNLPVDNFRLLDVFQVSNGANVNEVNRETLDLLSPTWQTSAQGPATDWMRHIRNPSIFFVYPPSPAGQVLSIEYCKTPGTYGLAQTVDQLSDVYFPCVVDGAVWILESVDNEHVNSGRAKMMYDNFMQMLGVSVQTKAITDNETSGQDPAKVV